MAKNKSLYQNIKKLAKTNKNEKVIILETILYLASNKELSLKEASILIKMLEQ